MNIYVIEMHDFEIEKLKYIRLWMNIDKTNQVSFVVDFLQATAFDSPEQAEKHFFESGWDITDSIDTIMVAKVNSPYNTEVIKILHDPTKL